MELLSRPLDPDALRLDAATPLEDIEQAARDVASLVLVFGAFRDGRGFSAAATLRARGYAGRLIASGAVLPDQVRHLRRSGFDAVEIGDADAQVWRSSEAVITRAYARQSPYDGARTAAAPLSLHEIAAMLNARYADADASTLIRAALSPVWGLRPAVLSSFGAEAAVLLDIVADVDPSIPVLFLDTGQHFLQTLSYHQALTERLALKDVRVVRPDPAEAGAEDPSGDLWRTNPHACCDLRKTRPLGKAASEFNLLLTGRKRYHGGLRGDLPLAEVLDGSLRLNPLAAWSADRVRSRFEERQLPPHPLLQQGYASIGCWPCTRPVDRTADARAGRWAGTEKTECGIHLSAWSKQVEQPSTKGSRKIDPVMILPKSG